MPLRPRASIQGISPAVHGGINYAELEELGIAPAQIIDFSANLNPFGPPPGLREALRSVDFARYPDSKATEFKRALSTKLGVPLENLLAASGSTELIYLAALAYFEPGDKVLIIKPAFGEYEAASRIAGASIIEQYLVSTAGFRLDVTETKELIQKFQPKGIFINNPHNPTGRYMAQSDMEKILHACPDSLVILDEAYIAGVDNPWSSLGLIRGGNLLVLRSMTKDYALAGLRLGYGVAAPDIINTLSHIQPPWSVNAMAQQAGIFVLSQEKYVRECQVKIKEAKAYLVTELTRLGLLPLHSEASFLLVRVGDATEFRRRLLQHKILVRDCTSFGFPNYIRLAPRTMPECQRLVKVIKEMQRVEK